MKYTTRLISVGAMPAPQISARIYVLWGGIAPYVADNFNLKVGMMNKPVVRFVMIQLCRGVIRHPYSK
ncbi:hypothetical protein RND59_16935 [Vibrio ruber]|uniref:hypothetical protein n=1 Tax=Vibrio ruber TaxID=184755 RepID=UPI0028934DF7|nr:hypothetical protein [Vibrio ruber]WNJ97812.1 hypothetical protein RND59_16935 [Vibrio ruber]